MEMKTFKTVQVLTFGDTSPIKVPLPIEDGTIDRKDLLNAVASSLGLKGSSLKCFGVFDGQEWPLRLYREGDRIPVDGCNLAFQRWCFDPRLVRSVVEQDESAGNLLYQQAVHIVNSGRLSLNKEDEAKLEEFSSPDFTLMRDYIQLCEAQPGFQTFTFPECVLVDPVNVSPHLEFNAGSKVTLSVGKIGIQIISQCRIQGQHGFNGQWASIRSWSLHPAKKHVCFDMDLMTDGQTARQLSASLQTPRFMFVVDVIKAEIQQIQQEDPKCPKFYIDMVSQGSEGSTKWQNALYKYRK